MARVVVLPGCRPADFVRKLHVCRYGHGIRPFLDLGLFFGPMSLPVTSARGGEALVGEKGNQ